MTNDNPYAPPANNSPEDTGGGAVEMKGPKVKVSNEITLSPAWLWSALVVFCSALVGGLIGLAIGAALGVYLPSYYRSVFSNGRDPSFDPVAVGIGQGLTQGVMVGGVIGVMLVAVFYWYNSRSSRNAGG
jgi:hypothetical protein